MIYGKFAAWLRLAAVAGYPEGQVHGARTTRR